MTPNVHFVGLIESHVPGTMRGPGPKLNLSHPSPQSTGSKVSRKYVGLYIYMQGIPHVVYEFVCIFVCTYTYWHKCICIYRLHIMYIYICIYIYISICIYACCMCQICDAEGPSWAPWWWVRASGPHRSGSGLPWFSPGSPGGSAAATRGQAESPKRGPSNLLVFYTCVHVRAYICIYVLYTHVYLYMRINTCTLLWLCMHMHHAYACLLTFWKCANIFISRVSLRTCRL